MANPFDDIIEQHRDNAKRVGFSVQAVFPNFPEDPAFCYTVGLCEKLGAEIIIVAPGSTQILYGILSQTVIDCINKGEITVGKIELSEYKLGNGDHLRAEIIELDPQSPNANVFNLRLGDINKFYQVYVGDKNNLLPGEEGYDTENWGYTVSEDE